MILRREEFSLFFITAYQGCLVYMLDIVAFGGETGKTLFATFMMIFMNWFKMYSAKLNNTKITEAFIDSDLQHLYFKFWNVPQLEKYHLDDFKGMPFMVHPIFRNRFYYPIFVKSKVELPERVQ